MFEKKMRLDALYEFYGKMLTDKQSEIMDLYCNLDYSLGEISELHSVSRQAIHDTIRRTEKVLENYETQLGLFKRFQEKQSAFESILDLAEQFEQSSDPKLMNQIKQIAAREVE